MELQHNRIILVETSHPGNIGAAARSMKAMGLSRLVLVNPKHFPHFDATARASGAADILENAVVVDTLEEAISGADCVIGTSARSRTFDWPILTPRQAGEKAAVTGQTKEYAFVFGCERFGLSNEQLEMCHYHMIIPTSSVYSSLNLASAVQIVVYELFAAMHDKQPKDELPKHDYVGADAMAGFYEHLEQSLVALNYLDPQNPKKLMTRLKRLFARTELEPSEVNILRGVLSNAQTVCQKLKQHEASVEDV